MANSEDQMSALFEEGGIADEGMDTDPVSGNNIPPGSLPEEVRDDVPAMLSEGEYVVPADVLRFYGVKFFEDLRSEAKMGLAEMDSDGRIGGEPVMEEELPFSDEELMTIGGEEEPIQMNEGGVATPQTAGYSSSTFQQDPEDPTQVLMGNAVSTGYELITHYGPNGEKVNIPFFNGTPLGLIPAGYTQSPPQEMASDQAVRSDDDDDGPDPAPTPEKIDWAEAGIEDYKKALNSKVGGILPSIASVASPALGMVAKYAVNSENQRMIEGLETKLADKSLSDTDRDSFQGFYDTLIKNREENEKDTKLGIVEKSGLFGGQSTMLENLEDRNNDGVSFGDTWLGDLLGLDGKAGVQGDGLKDSLGGSRRDDVPSDDDSPSSNPSSDSSSGNSNSFFQNIANSFTPNDGKSYVNGELIEDDKDK